MEDIIYALIAGGFGAIGAFFGVPTLEYITQRREYKSEMQEYLKQKLAPQLIFDFARIEKPEKPRFRDIFRTHYCETEEEPKQLELNFNSQRFKQYNIQ